MRRQPGEARTACQTPLLIREDFRDRSHIPGLHLLTQTPSHSRLAPSLTQTPWKLRLREREPGGVGAIFMAGQGAGTGRCPSLEVTFLPSSNTKTPKATRKEARLLGCQSNFLPGLGLWHISCTGLSSKSPGWVCWVF